MSKKEYFINNEWHLYCNDENYKIINRDDYHKLINRETTEYKNINIVEHWFLGDEWHRIDGPAIITKDITTNDIIDVEWFVHDACLEEFDLYFSKQNPLKSILEYLKNYPYFTKEILLLAKHNNWLTEDQLVLLSALSLVYAENF